jgi:D-alanyl-D-alanine dipeptidase
VQQFEQYLKDCSQLIFSIADDEKTIHSRIYLFQRTNNQWQLACDYWNAVIGKNGLACGRGLINHENLPAKQEGDLKAPAGVFTLGTSFGEDNITLENWDYLSVKPEIIAVDDPDSAFYNQIINNTNVRKDWQSFETMLRTDGLYKKGLVINHNFPSPVKNAGSCIFMHIWRDPQTGTEGCTAMAENHIDTINHWLRKDKNPVFIQGTKSWVKNLLTSFGEFYSASMVMY